MFNYGRGMSLGRRFNGNPYPYCRFDSSKPSRRFIFMNREDCNENMDEKEYLKMTKEDLEAELAFINKRLKELD